MSRRREHYDDELDEDSMLDSNEVRFNQTKRGNVDDDSDSEVEDFVVDMMATVDHNRKEDSLLVKLNTNRSMNSNDAVLIWDTGAARHVFEFVPQGSSNIKDRKYKILLGGSSKHAVKTSSTFSVGFLQDVLLLPEDVKIGYNIVSAGQLDHLRTLQDTDGNFFVVSSVGDVISKGYIGEDNLFYLLDMNLLKLPRAVLPSRLSLLRIVRRRVLIHMFQRGGE